MNSRFTGALFLAVGLSSGSMSGQLLSFGVEAGVPLNDVSAHAGNRGLTAKTQRFIVGPKIEVRLPFHLGVEAEALYRRYSFNGSGVNEWDFPILVKYHFGGIPLIHPFIDAGPIFNHVSEIRLATPNQSTAGIAVGAGLDFRALIVHIQPEFRYIRWGDQNFNFSALGSGLASSQNQVQFLVGVTF